MVSREFSCNSLLAGIPLLAQNSMAEGRVVLPSAQDLDEMIAAFRLDYAVHVVLFYSSFCAPYPHATTSCPNS